LDLKVGENPLLPNPKIKTSKGIEANIPWLKNPAEMNVGVVL
jgi:hypothetical protein